MYIAPMSELSVTPALGSLLGTSVSTDVLAQLKKGIIDDNIKGILKQEAEVVIKKINV